MALIKCKECGKEISDKATNCIHCGYINKDAKPTIITNIINKKYLIVIGLIIIIIVFILTIVSKNQNNFIGKTYIYEYYAPNNPSNILQGYHTVTQSYFFRSKDEVIYEVKGSTYSEKTLKYELNGNEFKVFKENDIVNYNYDSKSKCFIREGAYSNHKFCEKN